MFKNSLTLMCETFSGSNICKSIRCFFGKSSPKTTLPDAISSGITRVSGGNYNTEDVARVVREHSCQKGGGRMLNLCYDPDTSAFYVTGGNPGGEFCTDIVEHGFA